MASYQRTERVIPAMVFQPDFTIGWRPRRTRHTPAGFVGASSSAAALARVAQRGPPAHMDLDHDLSGDDDALVFLRALADAPFDALPPWDVHSANPVGRDRIESILRSWAKAYAARC